jgi:hypothetical protein
LQVSVADFGLEIGVAELSDELAAQLPEALRDQAIPEVSADEFEGIYQWFLA